MWKKLFSGYDELLALPMTTSKNGWRTLNVNVNRTWRKLPNHPLRVSASKWIIFQQNMQKRYETSTTSYSRRMDLPVNLHFSFLKFLFKRTVAYLVWKFYQIWNLMWTYSTRERYGVIRSSLPSHVLDCRQSNFFPIRTRRCYATKVMQYELTISIFRNWYGWITPFF